MSPRAGVRLTLVLDRPEAVYSGMVPGFVAGAYDAEDLTIDVARLGRRAGARVVLAAAVGVRGRDKRIDLDGRPALAYDLASLNVGSQVRGLEVPGAREHALATRPVGRFVSAIDGRVAAARRQARGRPPRIVVVGAGAAGIELAFAVRARLGALGSEDSPVVVADGLGEILAGYPHRVAQLALEAAWSRQIDFRLGKWIRRVAPDAVELDGGERVAADLVLWAAGAAAPAFLAAGDLPHTDRGFLRVLPTLQVDGHPELFAAGDCAELKDDPWIPRAGVYAVREGPVLLHNLRAALAGARLRRYRPQRQWLSLIGLGDGTALGSRGRIVVQGRWVWRLKDRIDRRFVAKFSFADDSSPAMAVGHEAMATTCGGCAAKVAPSALARALARLVRPPPPPAVVVGLDQADDAAVLRLADGSLQVVTVDAFPAFTDDPWVVGRAAAVNAASDVFAKGAEPRYALAWVVVPEAHGAEAEETLHQALAGAQAAFAPMGVTLVGGHSMIGSRLAVGFAVLGGARPDEPPLLQSGLCPGDRLLLSKPLGTGVVFHADMRGRAPGRSLAAALDSVVRDNRAAARVARSFGARACTDVTGFGLAGHLGNLLRASRASAEIDVSALPALPGALALVAKGVRSTFHQQNVDALAGGIFAPPRVERLAEFALLFDPQTCGGLLFGVPEAGAAETVHALREAGDTHAAEIGVVHPARQDRVLIIGLERKGS